MCAPSFFPGLVFFHDDFHARPHPGHAHSCWDGCKRNAFYKARKTQADKAQVQFDHGEITAEMLEKSQNDLLWATGGLATSIVNITEAVEYAKRTHQQEQAVEYPDMV